MDNLTHTLTGILIGRTGLNRWCPRATAVLLMAVNVPELDVLALAGGDLAYLDHRRGITHGLAAMPLMAVLPLLVLLLFARRGVLWKRAYAVSLLGLAAHLALDLTDLCGARLFSPFSQRWFALEFTPLMDFWIWVILLLAAAWLLLSRLVSSEIGARAASGRGVAFSALALLVLFCFARYLLHQRALAVLDSRLYAGSAPRRVAAFPSFANPLRWTGLVETSGFHMIHDLRLGSPFDPEAGRIFFRPANTAAVEAARRTPAFQRFLRFARYPLWRVIPVDEPEDGLRVEVTDARFALPGEPHRRIRDGALFHHFSPRPQPRQSTI